MKQIIAVSTPQQTVTVVNGYRVVDMRHQIFTDNLVHGDLLIMQRSDGELYANRFLGGNGTIRLFGIDADEEATSSWIEGVERLLGYEASNWLAKNAPQNYAAWFEREHAAEMAVYGNVQPSVAEKVHREFNRVCYLCGNDLSDVPAYQNGSGWYCMDDCGYVDDAGPAIDAYTRGVW